MPRTSTVQQLEKAKKEAEEAQARVRSLTQEVAIKIGTTIVDSLGVGAADAVADSISKRPKSVDPDELAAQIADVVRPKRAVSNGAPRPADDTAEGTGAGSQA